MPEAFTSPRSFEENQRPLGTLETRTAEQFYQHAQAEAGEQLVDLTEQSDAQPAGELTKARQQVAMAGEIDPLPAQQEIGYTPEQNTQVIEMCGRYLETHRMNMLQRSALN